MNQSSTVKKIIEEAQHEPIQLPFRISEFFEPDEWSAMSIIEKQNFTIALLEAFEGSNIHPAGKAKSDGEQLFIRI